MKKNEEGAIKMITFNRNTAIRKIIEMSEDSVSKVLIFMAGMEAEHIIRKQIEEKQTSKGLHIKEVKQ